MYLNHIYQLAASARSVVAENKALRDRLEALALPGAPLAVSHLRPDTSPRTSPTFNCNG